MSNKSLYYIEFRDAAFRNISVCETLLKTYNTEIPIVQKQILYKTFYLGGYVVEFLYKFSLFSYLNLDSDENIYNYGDNSFKKKWKVHEFDKLRHLCEDNDLIFSTDIPYLGNNVLDVDVLNLFEAWDVQIRYSINLSRKKVDLQYSGIVKYIETIKDINNKINSIYS